VDTAPAAGCCQLTSTSPPANQRALALTGAGGRRTGSTVTAAVHTHQYTSYILVTLAQFCAISLFLWTAVSAIILALALLYMSEIN